jgi:hypothetical protein
MLAVTKSHQNYKNGAVSNQLTDVGRMGDVCWGGSEANEEKKGKKLHKTANP